MLIASPAPASPAVASPADGSHAIVSPATPQDRVNDLVHVAWRVAMGVILDPASANPARLLTGMQAAREGAQLLRTVTPNRPGEGWITQGIKAIELGAANLARCVELFTRAPAGGVDSGQLVRFAEQAEGDLDYAWEMIAADS